MSEPKPQKKSFVEGTDSYDSGLRIYFEIIYAIAHFVSEHPEVATVEMIEELTNGIHILRSEGINV